MDIDSRSQLFIYFQSIVPQNTPGGRNEFLPGPWEILGHPSGVGYYLENNVSLWPILEAET